MDARLAWAVQALIGHKIHVQTTSGKAFEGIFKCIEDVESAPVLRVAMATLTVDPEEKDLRVGRPCPELALPWSQVVRLSASNVGITERHLSASPQRVEGIGTDADISRGRGGRADRELQRWVPTAEDEAAFETLGGGLEDGHRGNTNGSRRGWDQFALNESKFGVRTDYAEELYTTALDPNRSTITAAEADRIAREIERGAGGLASNRHVLEERGVPPLGADGLDEEDLYGAVIRDNHAESSNSIGGESASNGDKGSARSAGSSSARRSAPIDIQARRETNKLRAQLIEGTAKKASPYGTPKSPLTSPLVSDITKLEALNLNPGTVAVDEDVRREFEEFKKTQATAAKKGVDLTEFKAFSQTLDTRLKSGSIGSNDKTSNGGATTAGEVTSAVSSERSVTSPEMAPKPKTALNPFAKSFTFNPTAKEFKPVGSGLAPASKPPATPATSIPAPGRAPSSTASTPTSSSGGGSFGASGSRRGTQRVPGGRPGRGPRFDPAYGAPYPRGSPGGFVPGPPAPYGMGPPVPMAVVDPATHPGGFYFVGAPVGVRGAVPPPGVVMLPYPPPPPMAAMAGPPGRPYPPGPPQGGRPRHPIAGSPSDLSSGNA